MGPSKQSLLSIQMFMKHPSRTTSLKHTKLAKKNEPKKFKPRVDKKAAKRLSDEEDIARGAEKWRHFLEEKGIEDVTSCRCDILCQANGDAPDPHAPYSHVEDTDDAKVADAITNDLFE